jgi:hypothetical protein
MNLPARDGIVDIRSLRETPWNGAAGKTRELHREGTAADPTWRLLKGSTRSGGLWEKIPVSHEAVLLGVGGPRVTVVLDGRRHRLSGEHPLLVPAGAVVSIERDERSPRSDVLMLIHRRGLAASLTMQTIGQRYETGPDTRALLPVHGTVRLPAGDAAPGVIAMLDTPVAAVAVAGATVVIVAVERR